MSIGLSLDSVTGPRQAGQPYFILADAVDREFPFPLVTGMLPSLLLKYWADSDSLVGKQFILTRGNTLLWDEGITRSTFGDPLNNPAAFQIERTLLQPVQYGDEIWVRTGIYANSWLAANVQDTTPPVLSGVSLPSTSEFFVGDIFTWTFSVSEQLNVLPIVTLNGRPVTVTQLDDLNFSASISFIATDLGKSQAVLYTLEDLTHNINSISNLYTFVVSLPDLISVNPKPGTYTSPISVTLTTTAPGTIRFTVDNSDPRTYQSQVYSSPISLSGNTRILVTLVNNNVASKIMAFEYVIQSNITDMSTTPSIYPVFERDIVIRGEAPASDGARVKVRVNDAEYWGMVKSRKYAVPVLALQLGDIVAVAVEDIVAGKSTSPWVSTRPSVRSDSYVLPEIAGYWGSQYPTGSPVELFRGDTITLEFPLTYKNAPLVLPSGRLVFYISPSRESMAQVFQAYMYQLPSGNWGVDLHGELNVTGTYWGEISIEQPDGGQTTLQEFPVIVKQDTRS